MSRSSAFMRALYHQRGIEHESTHSIKLALAWSYKETLQGYDDARDKAKEYWAELKRRNVHMDLQEIQQLANTWKDIRRNEY